MSYLLLLLNASLLTAISMQTAAGEEDNTGENVPQKLTFSTPVFSLFLPAREEEKQQREEGEKLFSLFFSFPG